MIAVLAAASTHWDGWRGDKRRVVQELSTKRLRLIWAGMTSLQMGPDVAFSVRGDECCLELRQKHPGWQQPIEQVGDEWCQHVRFVLYLYCIPTGVYTCTPTVQLRYWKNKGRKRLRENNRCGIWLPDSRSHNYDFRLHWDGISHAETRRTRKYDFPNTVDEWDAEKPIERNKRVYRIFNYIQRLLKILTSKRCHPTFEVRLIFTARRRYA